VLGAHKFGAAISFDLSDFGAPAHVVWGRPLGCVSVRKEAARSLDKWADGENNLPLRRLSVGTDCGEPLHSDKGAPLEQEGSQIGSHRTTRPPIPILSNLIWLAG